ncbi:sensory neuron membrane protein 1 [Planococcus citri]|uniref:sensory neuron membrane protein 1 n=1 Tax=Planococcus citri TaxID=170843 RepID=UPI0031F84CB3
MVKTTTLVVTGLIFIGLGAFIGWYGFPKMLHSKITQAKNLKKGTENRKNWAKFPLALDFKIYIYNVTNPDEVHVGKKAIVQQVGPFFYREWKSKANLVDDPEADTITYNMVNTWYFDEEESKPLTGDEVLVIPNILILTFATLTMQTKPGALNMINKAIPQLFGNPKNIFMTTTAKEFLFEGVLINCTQSKEFAVNTVCDQIRAKPAGLEVIDNDYFKFSIFGTKNNTPDENSLTVKRGIVDIQDVGKVVLYNGKPEMEFWSGPKCNEIKGTDTTIFPPFMDTKDVWNFGAEICRSLAAKYVGPTVFKGIHGYHYTADLGDMSTDPNLKCFCPTNDTCLKKGAFDVTKCTGAPLVLTLPHCYGCHVDYMNGVTGMNPSEELHGIYSTFEPITGTPVAGKRRLQFNMFVQQIKKITVMKELAPEPFLMPLLWVDEGLELNDTLARTVRNALYRPIRIVKYGRYILIGFGLFFIVMGVIVFYRKTKLNPDGSVTDDNKTTITQVSPAY